MQGKSWRVAIVVVTCSCLALLVRSAPAAKPGLPIEVDIEPSHAAIQEHEDVRPDASTGSGGWHFSILYENFYYATFGPLLLVTLALAWFTRPRTTEPLPPGFAEYRWKFLLVWYVAISADWLQGPYVYALYASYGFSSLDIAKLFVAGFGASAVFGTFVGSVADSWGRKRCAVLYCVLYAISCVTKHWNNYGMLMLGRVTGGVATSLLFTTFECWMVAEHIEKRKFSAALLRYMFGLMYFGMYASAVICGLMAQAAADFMPLTPVLSLGGSFFVGGYTAPFDVSMVILISLIAPICLLWGENHGDNSAEGTLASSMAETWRTLSTNWNVSVLGVVVASFEGCMYAFVFNWTPALESKTLPPPHGLIFSLFMMACMCGASAFSLTNPSIRPTHVLLPTFGFAAAALAMVALCLRQESALALIFYSFLAFEFCVGVYFPAVGTLKSGIVPETARAGVYNAYRVPLNAVVCGLLLSDFSLGSCFAICCSLLVVAVGGLGVLMVSKPKEGDKSIC